MTETQSSPAEARIAALEAGPAQVESALRRIPALLEPVNVPNESSA